MAQRSIFYQTCPVCGRSLRMPVEVFGRKVTCVHCGGKFRSEQTAEDDQTPASQLAAAGEGPLPGGPLSFVAGCWSAVDAQ
ncbi:MAG: transposase [Planctomycetaceae bacterium]|nr:transposase [Planctomycetaceae bacterium]